MHKTTIIILILLILVTGFVIAKMPNWTGTATSDGHHAASQCEGYSTSVHSFDVFGLAREHFDNPLQRLLTFTMDTHGYDNNAHTIQVAGYSFFRIKITEATYDCRGGLTTTKSFFFN
ncbi:hypothetical protein CL632_02195 [bacterium]|jgi:hypothetical protein|nr:hypothetical protein [bacterium]MAG28931.1 hypothetical protein [bacterium]|tara:strand:+ start:303 stop:656 length:354 start_codon:yes stop_codon:yes gene_type:complete